MGLAYGLPDSVLMDNTGSSADSFTFVNVLDPANVMIDSVAGNCNDVFNNPEISMIAFTLDDGTTDTCTFTLVVLDTIAPVLQELDTIKVQIGDDIPEPDSLFEEYPVDSIDDNCGATIASISITSTDYPVPGNPFCINRVYTVSDASSNMSEITQKILLTDTIPPMLNCTGLDITLSVDTLQTCSIMYEPTAPTATDLCGIDTIYLDNYDYPVAEYGVGVNTLQWIAIDSCDLSDTCEVFLTIIDNTPPTIVESHPDTTISCDVDPSQVYTRPVAVDQCDPNNILVDSTETSLQGVCPASYTLTRAYTLTDSSGNVAVDTVIIEVVDTTAPGLLTTLDPLAPIKCYQEEPPFQNLTNSDLQDNCSLTTLVMQKDTSPIMNTCSGYEVYYHYIASDVCGNADTFSTTLVILPDTDDPYFIDDLDTIFLSADALTCVAENNLPLPAVGDSCSSATVSMINPPVSFAIGEQYVTWEVVDDCTNSTQADQVVIVTDDTSPNIECKADMIISLTAPDANTVKADEMFSSTFDCDVDLTFDARRMEDPNFGAEVLFTCDDIGTMPLVVLRVTDSSGNANTCMVTIQGVEDKLPPVIDLADVLPNIEVSCNYDIDLDNLDEFGTFVFAEEDRQVIDIDPALLIGHTGPLVYGLATDYCPGVTLQSSYQDNRVNRQGQIIRNFVITDAQGLSIEASQIITVTLDDPLTEAGINFPSDTTFAIDGRCEMMPPPDSLTGRPTFNFTGFCTMPAIFKKDKVFDDPNSGCPVILREWTVIDMAQYTPTSGVGRWTDNQYIFIENTTPPTFDFLQQDTLIGNLTGSCDARMQFTFSAMDSCTMTRDLAYKYKIDLFSDGTEEIIGTTNHIDEVVPEGTHTIIWLAEDRCGNEAKHTFVVTAKEAKAPTPICINGLSTDLSGDETSVSVWASDFDNGSYDNCTAEKDLIVSFDPAGTQQSITFDTLDVGLQQVSVYVTDQSNNQSFCSTYITVTRNGSTVGGETQQIVRISGRITTEDEISVPQTKVKIRGVELVEDHMTEDSGLFLFDSLQMYRTYRIAPERDHGYMEGVSTKDLILIQRHLLKIADIESPYKIIAADVNADERITASDIVELRKLILGINNEFTKNESWRFVDKNFQFADPEHPWPFDQELNYDDLDANMMNSDFVAVKVGDVDNSVSNTFTPSQGVQVRGVNMMKMLVDDLTFEEGDVVTVPLVADQNIDLLGLQMSLQFDPSVLDYVSVSQEGLQVKDYEYANAADDNGHYINFAIANNESTSLITGQNAMNIEFIAKKSGKLSNVLALNPSIIDAVVYDTELRSNHIVLDFVDQESVIEVLGAQPNPFTSSTTIKFSTSEDMPVEMSILDNMGRKIYRDFNHFTAGTQKIYIGSQQLGNRKGVFYLHLECAEKREIIKLLRIN